METSVTRQDHRNESANSYDTGVRSKPVRQQNSSNRRNTDVPPIKSTKLYLHPLNESHTKEVLSEMFRQFGEVSEIYIDEKKHRWAFVSLATQEAADRALCELTDQDFTVTYAKERQTNTASSNPSQSASPGEVTKRKKEDTPQTGSQFIKNFVNRSVPDTSERPTPRIDYSPPFIPDINQYAPIPLCLTCSKQTCESCTKCKQPFCSKKCMIVGFEGHSDLCIIAPRHSTEIKNPSPLVNGSPFPTISQDFADTSRSYLDHVTRNNSYKDENADELDVKHERNNSRELPPRSAVQNSGSKKYESRKSAGDESPQIKESHRMNGTHRMKEDGRGRHRTSINAGASKATEEGDALIGFTYGQRNFQAKRERDGKLDRSNKENEFSRHESSSVSRYRSNDKNELSRNESSSVPRHRSNEENESSWPSSSQKTENVSIKENGSSRDNQSRESRHRFKKDDESWDNESQASGYVSKAENESPRKKQSQESRHRPKKENESSWDNESQVSGYVSRKMNDSTRNNEYREPRPKTDNESSKNNRSSLSGSRPQTETAALRIRSSNESSTSRGSRSPVSRLSRNQSPCEKMSDDETSTKRRRDSGQREVKPREFENRRNVDASPLSSPKLEYHSPRPRNAESSQSPYSEVRKDSPRPTNPEFEEPPRFVAPPRIEIKEKAKFEVRLAESEPLSIIIMQEADALNYMVETLQKFNLERVDTLEPRMKCVAKRNHDDIWYRCMIHQLDPLLGKFIDFNFTLEPIQKGNVRKLPEEFASIPPFCYRVNIVNAKKYEIDGLMNSNFDVEFVKKIGPLWDVKWIKKSFDKELPEARRFRDSTKPSVSSESPRNTQDYSDLQITLKKDVPVKVFVTYIDPTTKKMYVTIPDKSQKLNDMITKKNPSSLPELKELRPKILCLANFEGCWCRARIVSDDPLQVYYIDFGNTEPAQKSDLRMSPGEFAHIDPLVVAIKFRSGAQISVNDNEEIDIIPIQEVVEDKFWVVRLASEPEVLENRSPVSSNEEYVPNVALNEILEVQVTFPISQTEYYVAPVDFSEKLKKVDIKDSEVHKMGPVRTPSLDMPCIAMYDGYWSRAKIVKLEPLTVFFIDFGNSEKAKLEELYRLPEKFQDIPPMAFKIHLQEPVDLHIYLPFKIKKVSDRLWRVHLPPKPEVGEDVDVLILAKESVEAETTYGVIPVDMDLTFTGIQEQLLKLKEADELPTVEEPEINLVCAEVGGVVARVQVLQTKPLQLHYLDFGFEEIKDTYCDLRSIPDSLAQFDPVAFKIILKNNDVELKEQQTVNVNIVDEICDGYYLVDVNNDSLSDSLSQYGSASEANTTFFETINSPPQSSEKTIESSLAVLPPISERNVLECDICSETGSMDTECFSEEYLTIHPTLPAEYRINKLTVGTRLKFTVMNNLNDSRCTGMIMAGASPRLHAMMKFMKKMKADPYYKPKVGDHIAAVLPASEDVWSRAVVLSEPSNLKSKYRVAMIDLGCANDVEEIAPLDDCFRDHSNLSVYCEITQFPSKRKPLKLFQTYKCTITEDLGDGTLVGSIEAKPDRKYEVNLKPWKPTFDELGVFKVPVSTESRVRIIAHNLSNTCHIVLCDEHNLKIAKMFMDDLMDYCVEAEPMTEEPFISEIVGVEYDDTFWRGQVLEKLENEYSIFLLDGGIKCTSRLEHLRKLPNSPNSLTNEKYLKTSFAQAVPVTLKNVPVTDITLRVSSVMESLTEKECPFDMLIDNGTGEVELKFLDEQSYGKEIGSMKTLNEYLAKSLTPIWKKYIKDPNLMFDDPLLGCMSNDLQYDELVVGSKMTLHVALVSDKYFILVNKYGKNYQKFFEVNLFGRLMEYATSIPQSYVPSPEELCIVADEDDVWYRAQCLQSVPNSGFLVQLIDEGRMIYVSHHKIRRMMPEFSHYAATALIVAPEDGIQFDEQKAKKWLNDTIRVRVLGMKQAGEYYIDCSKIFS